ncbi:hypothetical protein NPIL_305211 [Nephila pilipes]|uniref:Uncharacterized protein n=1 Tax=Nephila pilipes TaxID=299642 RepID=A0A8X6NAP4_NEPPI|nr:hypothetical protein NPIL_305211 [Nephila pilipes]
MTTRLPRPPGASVIDQFMALKKEELLLRGGVDVSILVDNNLWYQRLDSLNSFNSKVNLNVCDKYYSSEIKSKDLICLAAKTSD